MIVVAGPPCSGKSSLYPLSSFGCAYVNADDRAAELTGGSYIAILPNLSRRFLHVRLAVFKEIVEQLTAGDLIGSDVDHLAARLLAENLVSQPLRIVDVRGTGRPLNLPAVDPVGDVPDFAALEDCAGTV